MVIHSVMARRAGFSIDWSKTDKTDYLTALTKEIDAPGKGALDTYLKPFIGEVVAYDKLAGAVMLAPGLDGKSDDENVVLGETSEPEVRHAMNSKKLNANANSKPG